jgi:hypothetical protein
MEMVKALKITVSDHSLAVDLSDGRSVSAPLAWYLRLITGSSRERSSWRLIGGGVGIHWPDLDEDLSVEGIILGRASGESQASLQRWLESRNRTLAPSVFEAARAKYRPHQIKLLFIAEAPPAYDSERFFYFEQVDRGDALFLEMMKVLYPKKLHFDTSSDTWEAGFSAKQMRKCKRDFLETFRDDGFYLVDAVDEPMPPNATPKIKEEKIRGSLDRLKVKLNDLRKRSKIRELPVVLIGAPVFNVCAEVLRHEGKVHILNQEAINTPAQGGQKLFRHKLGELLASNQVKTSDDNFLGDTRGAPL